MNKTEYKKVVRQAIAHMEVGNDIQAYQVLKETEKREQRHELKQEARHAVEALVANFARQHGIKESNAKTLMGLEEGWTGENG